MHFSVYLTHFNALKMSHQLTLEMRIDWLTKALEYSRETHPVLPKATKALKYYQSLKTTSPIAEIHVASPDFTHTNWKSMGLFQSHWISWFAPRLEDRFTYQKKIELPYLGKVFSSPQNFSKLYLNSSTSPSARPQINKELHSHQIELTESLQATADSPLTQLETAKLHLKGSEKIRLCFSAFPSLHTQPHSIDEKRLLSNAVFGDGLIYFDISSKQESPSLELVGSHQLRVDPEFAVGIWNSTNFGLQTSFTENTPKKPLKALPHFCKQLADQANWKLKNIDHVVFCPQSLNAHQEITAQLNLSREQIRWSEEIFSKRGYMACATLPHIWKEITNEKETPAGSKILSFSFGPSGNLVGNLLKKLV